MNNLSDPPDRLGAIIDAGAAMAQVLQDILDETLVYGSVMAYGEIDAALGAWESAYAAISPEVAELETQTR